MSHTGALTDQQRLHWLRLTRTQNIGPVTFAQLLLRYGTAENALNALPSLARKKKLTPPPVSEIEAELEQTQQYGARIIASCEPDYPEALRAVDPPPPVITVLGNTDLFTKPAIAIVGARNASAAGRKLSKDISTDLGKAGYVIASGLARGIDGEAHAASLQTGTIAVLGGGIDHIYPPQHDRLYAAVAAQGAIVSESFFGHRAKARDFPRRNRIITGLARGVVVIEAAIKSGSLISARTAMEQNREVMAVPGSPLDPRSQGANSLIQQGAALINSADDVLDVLNASSGLQFEMPQTPSFEGEPGLDVPPPDQIDAVREALSFTPTKLDDIARAANISAARCTAILVELELDGVAITLPGGLAILADP